MAPVTATNIIGLAFNIYCLKLVDASYFQVARGLTLPMTVVLQSLTTGEKPTMGTIASCGLVTWGFTYSFIPSPFGQSASTPQTGIASTEAPMLGMALGVAAAAMVAIHAILIKQALKVLDGRTLDL
jgi:GDP-fucose transporter C1